MAERSTARRLRHKQRIRRRAIGGVVVCAVAGAGIATWQVAGAAGPQYRLTSASRADVAQTVDADGTVSVADQATLTFATSGTVATVLARQGAHVTAGQVLARLDATSLENAVTAATQQLAQSRQTLADDEASQTSTTAAAVERRSSIVLTAAVVRPSAAPGGSSGGSSGVSAVKAAQSALVDAVHGLDAALQQQDQDVATAASACSATADGTALTAATSSDSSGAVTGTIGDQSATVTLLDASGTVDTTTRSANPQQVSAGGQYSFTGLAATTVYELRVVRADKVIDTADCTSALATVSRDRARTDRAADQMNRSVSALTSAVASLHTAGSGSAPSGTSQPGGGTSSAPQSGSPSRQPGGTGSGTGSGTGGGSSGDTSGSANGSGSFPRGTSGGTGGGTGGSSSTRVVTAQQIVADQKAVDAARAQLRLAQRNRGFASLTAPISGTVADIGVSPGQSVSTSTTAMTVVGSARKQITVDVGIDRIDLVKVGQHAAVTVDGRTAPIGGTVTRVGMLNTASAGSTSSYAVTIDLGADADAVHDGTGASVAITVGTARQVLTVPLSAVHTVGSLHTVEVYSGGNVTVTQVTLGVVGSDRVQIVHGLTAGQRVVLANLSAAVPSSTTTSRFGISFGEFSGGGPVR